MLTENFCFNAELVVYEIFDGFLSIKIKFKNEKCSRMTPKFEVQK